MDIEKKLEQLKSRYEELAVALSDPGIYDQPEKLTEVTKEHSSLKSLVEDFEKWKNLKNQIRGNEEVIAQNEDPELTEMARMELKELKQELESL